MALPTKPTQLGRNGQFQWLLKKIDSDTYQDVIAAIVKALVQGRHGPPEESKKEYTAGMRSKLCSITSRRYRGNGKGKPTVEDGMTRS